MSPSEGAYGDGEDNPSTFETMADFTLSRRERYFRIVDNVVLASFKIVWSDWRTRTGVSILFVYLLFGLVGVHIVELSAMGDAEPFVSPFTNWQHPLGTDKYGRGIFSHIVHATPPMLQMVFAGAIFAVSIGALIGTFSGYKGGNVDMVTTTFIDIMMTIPALPLVITLLAIWQPRSPWILGILLSINGWAGLGRAVRSEVLSLRYESYVEASRTMNISTIDILLKDIMPNLMPYVLINFVNAARGIIFGSVGLYFLGLLPVSQVNWGVMLQEAFDNGAHHNPGAYHWILIPVIVISLFSFGLVLIAQGAEQLFNPRVRARHEKQTGDETIQEMQ